MTLLLAATILFALAALGGLALARGHLGEGGRPPRLLAMGHGLLAAGGMILLGGAYVRTGGPTRLAAALVVLTAAVLAGVTLSSLRAKGRALKGRWILGHALLAGGGLALLVLALAAGVGPEAAAAG